MTFRLLPALAAFILFIPACHTNKKSRPVAVAEPAIQSDTIHVTASRAEAPAEKLLYRGSNPRSSDILHTRLEVNFDWKLSRMNGKATLKIKPYFHTTDKLYLDARGMEIISLDVFDVTKVAEPLKKGNRNVKETQEVWQRLASSSYVYENDSLKINLGKSFTKDDYYYVVISYIARPNELTNTGGSSAITDDKGLYFINPNGLNPMKMPQIWTQGETQANSVWFPTIDSPNERMTQEILITVDDKYTTLSNGLLVASTLLPGGMRTDHWKLDEPHAPYLAMMAVGEFVKLSDTTWNGKEISYYVEKLYAPHAKAIFSETAEMIGFYSGILGVPYAWPKYAQVVARDYVSGAMENTSATLHGDFMVYQTTRELIDGNRGTAVIAHELFHQWFGDLVTCESWSNLPLNESFATYGEYLWEEYKNGRDAADHHHMESAQSYFHSKKEVDLIRFHYNNKEDMFDAFSYAKGGQVLHMLRKAVGDEAFFASLKYYLEENRFKPVEIHHLRLAFEEITGTDMNWFFNQWFLNKGRPQLKVSKEFNAADSSVVLRVEQLQDLQTTPLYKLPLDVDMYVNGKVEKHHIVIETQKQEFRFKTGVPPQLLNFDAERQLLCDLEYQKSDEEYIFQYKHAPLYGDRMEALKALGNSMQVRVVFDLFREAALSDKFHAIRKYAVGKIERVTGEYSPEIKGILLEAYKNDTHQPNRARALTALNKRFLKDEDVIALNTTALQEESYAICAQALTGLSRHDPQIALQKARAFEKESGREILFALGALYAEHGSDAQVPFFHNALKYINGFDILSFSSLYTKTAKRCSTSTAILMAATDLEMLGRGANRYTKYVVTNGIKDLLSSTEEREKATQEKIESLKRENKSTAEAENDLKMLMDTRTQLKLIYDNVQKG